MFQIVFFAVIVAIIGCSYYMIGAQKKLSVEDKAKLIDATSRKRALVPIIVLFVGLFVVTFLMSRPSPNVAAAASTFGFPALIILVLLVSVWSRISSYRRLKALGLPTDFLRSMVISNAIIYLVMVVFVVCLFYSH